MIQASPPPAAAAERAPACAIRPTALYALPGGKTYAVVLRGSREEAADVHLVLYSAAGTYEVALSAVRFRANGPRFESTPRFIALPVSDSVVATEATGEGATWCGSPYAFSDAFLNERRQLSKADADEATLLAHAYERGISTIEARAVEAKAADCAQPFALPQIAHRVGPLVPPYLNAGPAHVEVSVRIDAAGMVTGAHILRSSGEPERDANALAAAEQSAYAPAVIRCRPQPSALIYEADFASSASLIR